MADLPRSTIPSMRGRTSAGRRDRRAAAWTLAFCLAFAGAPWGGEATPVSSARAEEPQAEKSVDPDAVFYGDARQWKAPAELDPDAVYARIEEYRQILDEKIDPADAKYSLLLSKARRRFLHAVRAVARDGGYDLVARAGSVRGAGTVPVVTQDVIAKL